MPDGNGHRQRGDQRTPVAREMPFPGGFDDRPTRGQRLLRGRTFTVLGRELHTTSVITGLLIMGVGVLFWTTNGLVGAPEVLPLGAQAWLQERASLLANPLFDILAVLAVAALVLLLWAWRRRRDTGPEGVTSESAAFTSDRGSRR